MLHSQSQSPNGHSKEPVESDISSLNAVLNSRNDVIADLENKIASQRRQIDTLKLEV